MNDTPTLTIQFDDPDGRRSRLYVRLPGDPIGVDHFIASGRISGMVDTANRWIRQRGFAWNGGKVSGELDRLQAAADAGTLDWGILTLATLAAPEWMKNERRVAARVATKAYLMENDALAIGTNRHPDRVASRPTGGAM